MRKESSPDRAAWSESAREREERKGREWKRKGEGKGRWKADEVEGKPRRLHNWMKYA